MRGGALDASVTLEEVVAAVSSKRVPLAPELAGYLALELSEHADAASGDIDPKSVFVSDEGTVALVRSRRDRVVGDAEASIRTTLGRLLDASGSQTPALSAAARRRSGAGLDALASELEAALIPVNRAAARRALARLVREVKRVAPGVGRPALPSSLPLQTNVREPLSFVAESSSPPPPAPQRPPLRPFPSEEESTLARSKTMRSQVHSDPPPLWNEGPTGEFERKTEPIPTEADIDALIAQFRVSDGSDQQHARALKAIAELEATPPPPRGSARVVMRSDPPPDEKVPVPPARESDIEALLALNDESPAAPMPPIPPTPGPPSVTVLHRAQTPTRPRAPSSVPAPSPSPRRSAPASDRAPPMSRVPPKRARAAMPSTADLAPRHRSSAWIVLLAVVALAGGAFGAWKLRGDIFAARPSAPAPPPPAPTGEPPPACLGTLVVSDVPPRAEVLLREGQAPVEIPRMPVGARLEFVATAEGFAPKRVVVPGGVPWDQGPDAKPRFEAAVQLDPSKARGANNDPWPVGEPGSAVGGEGPPGSVRVVANPRGAEVWMLAGIAPEARIERLRCDQDIDVLLAGPTTYRNRLRVRPSDFLVDDGPQPPGTPRMPGKPRLARVSAK